MTRSMIPPYPTVRCCSLVRIGRRELRKAGGIDERKKRRRN